MVAEREISFYSVEVKIAVYRKNNDPIVDITCKQYKARTRNMKRNLKKDFFWVALEDAKGDSGKA